MRLTPRENALLALDHKVPERIVYLIKDCNMLGNFLIREKGPASPEFPMGGTGKDWFGVQWRYEESSRAPMVDPDYPPIMDDITQWRSQIVFPDLDSIDFKAEAKRELSSPMYDPDKLNQVCIQSGPFERLLDCMGCEEALISMMTEPEACREFFDAIIDYKIELIDRLAEVYPIDLIDFHDDWGTQISTFMSVDMWKELLAEPIARVCKHCKDKGIHIQIHSCGKVETLVPEMVKAGVEHWSSCQAVNDIERLVHEFGDRMTFFGCMDTYEVRIPNVPQEEVDRLTAERIDNICRGGCVFPLGNSTVPGLREAVDKALSQREHFFDIPENRVLP